jgi:hypothetical protein
LTGSCEKRGVLATEGKRKSEGVIASATPVWRSRVERMAKHALPDLRLCVGFFRDNAVAAITSGGSRNHGEHWP